MIKLHFGSELTQFLDSILHNFKKLAQKSWAQSMNPPTLIAGSPLIQKWLSQKLAEENGIVMGLQVQRLEASIWNILVQDDSNLLTVDSLEPILLRIMRDKVEGAEDTDPVWGNLRSYLYKDGQIEVEKWVQLAKKWSRSFLEYELNRPAAGSDPGLLAKWARGELYFTKETANDPCQRVEKTQMALWQCLVDELQNQNLPLKSLPMLWDENRKLGFPKLSQSSDKPKWIVVGLPGLSHFHRNALMELGGLIDLEIYLLNPCAEFWEDLDTRRTTKKLRKIPKLNSEQYGESDLKALYPELEADQKLLELWGAADKENLILWGQVSDDLEFEKDPLIESELLLHRVQNLVLTRQNNLENKIPQPEIAQDSSLFLIEAPTRVRELETIRDLALGMMDPAHPLHVPGLAARDFCLLLPDLGAYQVALEQSFLQGSSMYRLPVFIWKGLGKNSLVSALLNDWLALIQGEFQRGKVFKFLQNPLVLSKLGLERAGLAEWENWASQLNLYRGFDQNHRQQLGDHEAIEIHTWQYAFDRMIAGWLAQTTLDFGDQEVHPWKASVLDNRENMAKMISEVSKLHHSLVRLRTMFESAAKFDKSIAISEISNWIDLEKLDFKEEQIWDQWLQSLDGLELQDTVDSELFCSWTRGHLQEELEADLLKYTGSMLIAPLRMGHILPHKVIFLAGLGSDFPGQVQKSSMDLLMHNRILGDMDPVKNSQAAFLHALLAAKNKLILSYNAQNIQKDEVLYPSSVITELDTYLSEAVFGDSKSGLPRLRVRLLNRDPQNLQADSITFNYDKSLVDALCSKPTNHEIARTPWRQGDLQLRDLAEFIKSPLDYRLRRGLGLYDEETEDSTLIENEPLAWDNMQKAVLLKQTALRIFTDPDIKSAMQEDRLDDFDLETIIDALIQDQRIEGLLAEGYFENAQMKTIKEFAQQCLEHLKALGILFPDHQWIGREHEFWAQKFPAHIEVDLGDSKVKLSAELPEFALYSAQNQSLVLLNITGSKNGEEKLLLPGLQSLWIRQHWPHKLSYLQIGQEDLKIYTQTLDPQTAKEQIELLVREERSYEISPSNQHLPFAPCWKFKSKELDKDELLEKIEGDHSGYYPNQAVQLVNPEIPDEHKMIFERRTQGLFTEQKLTEVPTND